MLSCWRTAGSGMNHPFMVAVADELAALGIASAAVSVSLQKSRVGGGSATA